MSNQDLTHLIQAIMEMKGSVERMSERQEEMVEDVKKIKEAVYNPDSGLYARLRALEQWKDSQAKFQWLVGTTLVALVISTLYKAILSI